MRLRFSKSDAFGDDFETALLSLGLLNDFSVMGSTFNADYLRLSAGDKRVWTDMGLLQGLSIQRIHDPLVRL